MIGIDVGDEFAQGIQGYLVENFDVTCLNTGDVCPAQRQLVVNAMSGVTEQDVESGKADELRSRVCMQLNGYDILAKTVSCNVNTACAVRETVKDSPALQVAMNGAKALHHGIFGFKRKLKG